MICLSLFGTTDEISETVASSEADLFEIRLDLSQPLDLLRIRSVTNKKLIFTSHEKPELLNQAMPYADYIDIGELRNVAAGVSPRRIVSIHADDQDPVALWNRFSGEHLTKIVLNTDEYATIARLIELNRSHPGKALCFAMGEIGAFSRIISVLDGAPWIYAAFPNKPTAPGQFTVEELTNLYRINRFAKAPSIFGIVGDPVSHSRSPKFHNQKFAEHNLPWIYLRFPCKDLDSLFEVAPRWGTAGFSITHPWKERAAELVSNSLELDRSCNTVCFSKGRWIGKNTDGDGVTETIKKFQVAIANSRVVILGAGGAARTIAKVIRPHLRELIFLNRTRQKANQLATEFQGASGVLNDLKLYTYDILFQATPIGLRENESPIDPNLLKSGTTVIDTIYNPPETMLLRKAKEIGCRTINGETWFLAQAEAQFEWWKNSL